MGVTANGWRRGHATSKICAANAQRRRQRERVLACQAARERRFTINGTELKSVELFKYLGKHTSTTDSDWPALQKNLAKARKRWGLISRLLVSEGASAPVSGLFYKAAILTVLLYGSESWVWTQRMYKAAESFHNHVARRISGKVGRFQNGTWTYPPIKEALKACSMHPLSMYIHRRRDRIQQHAFGRDIYEICKNTGRLPGTPTRLQFWWEQHELPGQNGLEE